MTAAGSPASVGPAVALALAAVTAVVDWVAVWAGGPRGLRVERLAKPAVLLALIATAVLVEPASPEARAVRPWLVAGLLASLAGDVLLLPPGRFVPGLVAFLAAHVCYLVAFARLPGDAAWLAAGIIAALVMAGSVGRVLVWSAARSGLALPVAAYLVAILAMAVAATRTGEPAAIAGAWLFVASDAMLGWGRLREPAPGMPRGGGRGQRVAVMVTYHLGQLLILLALVA